MSDEPNAFQESRAAAGKWTPILLDRLNTLHQAWLDEMAEDGVPKQGAYAALITADCHAAALTMLALFGATMEPDTFRMAIMRMLDAVADEAGLTDEGSRRFVSDLLREHKADTN